MVAGWDRAVRTMAVGERATIRVTDPTLGYGSAGVPPLIPPNSVLEFDVQVLDAQEPTLNIDFDTIAMADNTPVSDGRALSALVRLDGCLSLCVCVCVAFVISQSNKTCQS
jgi:hypothetical protein